MKIPEIKTKKLIIRPLSDEELEELCNSVTDAEEKKAYGEMLEGCRSHHVNRLWYTAWEISLRETGERVGDICFKGTPENNETEIGYGIDEQHRNRGYASEAVKAMTEWAFSNSGELYFVTAQAAPENNASIRVLQKNGFVPAGQGDEGLLFEKERPCAPVPLWEGEHRYVEVHSADYAVSLTLLLSQPVTQGSGGIWCVEGSFDNNYGGWGRELPYGIEVTEAEYYADLQAQVDQGHRPGLLDPVQAAMEWYQEKYDAENLDGLTFTLMEGEPAGDLGSTIRQVAGQTGTLESLFYLDGDPGSSEGRLAFHDPEFLSGEVRWYLQTFVWMEAQGPETIEGEAVRYQAESGDELLFLEEDGLLRITIGDEVFWYRPAYAYQVSPYDKLMDCCAALAQEEDPFTWEQTDAGMDALRAWLESEGWEAPLEGTPQYLPLYARYYAQTYLENGNGQNSGLGRADVLVLCAAFPDAPQGAGTYVFWLIPDGSGGWQVDDWGQTTFPDLAG